GDLAQRHGGPARVLAHDLAVDHRDRIGILLHELGRDIDRLGTDFNRGAASRLACHDRRAGCERPHPEWDAVGAAVHDPPATIIDADRIAADLRPPRSDALAERSRPGHALDHTGGVDRYPHAVERPEPALLDEEGKSRPNAFATGATAFELALQIA